jgi:hypothetical protein
MTLFRSEKTPRKPINKSKILLAGPVRNVADKVQHELETLITSFGSFQEIHCFVVESDSNDNTVKELEELQGLIKNFSFISAGKLSEKYPRRTDRIALCRNLIIDAVTTNPLFADIDFIAMADLDGMNSLVTPEKVADCWAADEEWDVITANQQGPYYDIWALRHSNWCPADCWRDKQALEGVIGDGAAENLAITARQVILPAHMGLIEVDSAFGGLAIYKREAFLAGRYAGTDAECGFDVADHVPFHQDLRKKGYRIFINCALVNCMQYPSQEIFASPVRPRGIFKVLKKMGNLIFGKKRFNKYLDSMKSL